MDEPNEDHILKRVAVFMVTRKTMGYDSKEIKMAAVAMIALSNAINKLK